MPKGEGNVVAQNKKARHDYSIVDTIEAGIVLTGTEIKSVRAARIQLKDGYAQIKNGEAWLLNVHIAPFEQGNIWNQDPDRIRKLLLKKKQIAKLANDLKGTGMTLVPLLPKGSTTTINVNLSNVVNKSVISNVLSRALTVKTAII